MAQRRQCGYRMWANTDRCEADHDLRHVRRTITRARATIARTGREITAGATDARTLRTYEVAVWALGVALRNEEILVRQVAEHDARVKMLGIVECRTVTK